MVNQDGIELKAGMKVKGWLTIPRSYGRTWNKDIEGTIVERNKQLYVNSHAEPEKNYPLHKFEHNFLTQPKVAILEVLPQ